MLLFSAIFLFSLPSASPPSLPYLLLSVHFWWRWVSAAACAAAKSLQSCPTLCDPRDGSPPGSPVPGILQAFSTACGLPLIAENGGHPLLAGGGCPCREGLPLLRSTGWRHMGFSSCGSWAELLRGMWRLPGAGIEHMSPALAGGFLTTGATGKTPQVTINYNLLSPHLEVPYLT